MVRSASFALLAVALLAGSARAGSPSTVQVHEGANPVAGAANAPVSFGSTEVATAKALTFTLRNTGTAALTVDPLMQIPQGFTAYRVPAARVLEPGQATTFAIALNSARAGYFAGPVLLQTSAGPVSIPIQGTAFGRPSVRVLDNSDAGFRVIGPWAAQNGQGLQGSAVAAPAGAGTNVAAWTFRGLTPGLYQVSATWTPGASRATNARYTLVNGGQSGVVTVNQQALPGDFRDAGTTWQRLGQPFKIDGHTLVVQLSDLANGAVVADAVRIERVGLTGQIMTPADPGFQAVGNWSLGAADRLGAPVQSTTGSATWTFRVRPGQYRVSANWLENAGLARNATYTIADGDNALATVAVNQQQAPAHFRDAGARWQDLGPLGGLYAVKSGTLTVTLAPSATRGPIGGQQPAVSASAIRVEEFNGSGIQTSADVTRFLQQATWGPTPELAQYVEYIGLENYLIEQYYYPQTNWPVLPLYPQNTGTGCPFPTASFEYVYCVRDNYQRYLLQNHHFFFGTYGWDQLRQKMAFGLHKLIVTGGTENDTRLPSRMRPILQFFTNRALGNYRPLLEEVTKNAHMGAYLDMVGSTAAQPNENYAREILQLFSIGLDKLYPDGTPQLDGFGNRIPTYDQPVVDGFTKAFTGWNLAAPVPAPPPLTGTVPNYTSPIVPGALSLHNTGSKLLLDGFVLPPDTAAGAQQRDLTAALNNIFNHPNCGPFIAKNLIQHFVTSNPSPDYVLRAAYWFDGGDGSVSRGDLGAMLWAILVDPEARAIPTDPNYGKLREPVQLALNLVRAFNATSHDGLTYSDGYLNPQTNTMGQNVFDPPSVFSYFAPDNPLPGSTTLFAPEFQILDTATAIRRANFVNTMTFGGGIPVTTGTGFFTINAFWGTALNLSPLTAISNDPGAMCDYLNDLLLHGTMSTAMRNRLITAITDVPATNPLKRARTAVYLVVTSSQYQVQR